LRGTVALRKMETQRVANEIVALANKG